MVLPTDAILREITAAGISVLRLDARTIWHVPLEKFFALPEPGERDPWQDRVHFSPEPYDDGGGAAVAGYRFAHCVRKGAR